MFRTAVKHEAKLRLAIAGPSGSGKTYTALAVGTALAREAGDRVAVVDTEHGSASKYADIFDFDVVNFDAPFHPDRFVEAIHMAEDEGYDVIILDSVSHAWNGTGGLLEIVDIAARKYKGNSYMAWSEGTPIQNRLIESIVGSRIHVIATMRSKQDYVLIERNGKQVPQKVGMAPIQRDGFEYEFDLFLEMDVENNAIVSKTRCPALTGAVIREPGAALADTLLEWLQGVKPPTEEELVEMVQEASTLDEFLYAAFRLDGIDRVLESENRLADWYSFVAGDFDPKLNKKTLNALYSYCDAVGEGTRVKDAAEQARQLVQGKPEAQKQPA
ncbi:MAG: ATP-binding protein [Chloroflexota bacterium]